MYTERCVWPLRRPLEAMQKLETLQKKLAQEPENTQVQEEINHCNAVVDAMDAYQMDTQIKKVLNGMGFPSETWEKTGGGAFRR